MRQTSLLQSFATFLTSHKGAWLTLGLAVLLFAIASGLLSNTAVPHRSQLAPDEAQSTQVAQLLEKFPDTDTQMTLVIFTKASETTFSTDDIAALNHIATKLSSYISSAGSPPIVSDDHLAALLLLPMTHTADAAQNAVDITDLRLAVADHTPPTWQSHVTGGPAFSADITQAFDGADITLLLITIFVVALLLIITYRSPLLWLAPLAVVALADRLASMFTSQAGSWWQLQFDAGIISVLVFGAGTNYALLYTSRYREQLTRTTDHRTALAQAWMKSSAAILTSNLTVVFSLLTLTLAAIPGTRGLGIAAAIGLLVALVMVMTMLPAVLAVTGRRMFWPFIPQPHEEQAPRVNLWRRLALSVMLFPGRCIIAGVALLAVASLGLLGTSVGLTQVEKFRTTAASATGLEVLSEHFPAGAVQPLSVIAASESAESVELLLSHQEHVDHVTLAGTSTDGSLTHLQVSTNLLPGSEASMQFIQELRDTLEVEAPDAHALVGGSEAIEYDARVGSQQDFWLITPLILAIIFGVLLLLLRSVLAPVLLLITNIVSATAAIGLGTWLSRLVFEQSSLDAQVPLLAFLFLVALGIDYTIFLVHRAKQENATRFTRAGMVHAVTQTGSVITSAGVVLAAVFAALGVLPLVTLGQIGLIVGVGVLLDTFLVRTIIVPALFGMMGEKMWWPRRRHTPPSATRTQSEISPQSSVLV